jgi:hypothetical protein
MSNPALRGITFLLPWVIAGGSGDGFVAQGADDECSNSIVRLAHNSSPAASATIYALVPEDYACWYARNA